MKHIEDLSLKNMELAEQYLSGKMPLEEKLRFEKRLQNDQDLKDDLEIAKDFLANQLESKYSPETNTILQNYDFDQIRMERKAKVGQNIIMYGIGAMLVALLMVFVCALILFYMGKY